MKISRKLIVPAVALALSQFPALCAADPAPALGANLPAYIQSGQARDLVLSGQNLSQAASIALPAPRGLRIDLVKPPQPNDGQATVHIAAAADAEPGDREVRIIGPGGVSNPFIVSVGAYPLIEEKEPNNTADQAQPVTLPAVITGRLGEGGDTDQFKFHGLRGHEILFDAAIARLGSPLEPVLVIHDASGRELPVTTEMHEGDPLLVFTAPADADYRLEVRDLRFRGGANFDYRIQAGAIPYLEAVFPMSVPAGKVVELQAVGHNLAGGEKISLDLTHAQSGRVMVRAKTPLGLSNESAIEVTSADPSAEPVAQQPPALTAASAAAVHFPADISGRLGHSGSEDFFKFHLAQKQNVMMDVIARRMQSPLDALLTLRNATGAPIDVNNGAAGGEARISRELEPGDYVASVRDLTWSGGENYNYRLQIHPAVAPGASTDFGVRFLPDSLRIYRGGHAAIWCEVDRGSGFSGEVAVSLDGLPLGVAGAPATIAPSTSGYFTISAAPDAALGAFPIRLKAVATVNGQSIVRYAEPELNGREMQQAYLTVLDAAPFSIEPFALTPERGQKLKDEIAALQAKLAAPDPASDAAEAEWAKKIATGAAWTALEPTSVAAASGTALTKLPDGSVLASGAIPPKETYTVVTKTSVKAITAIRLEALTHPGLPGRGPGAAPNGNFVLTNFKVMSQKGTEPPQVVTLKNATADFSQEGFPVGNAIDADPNTGWAIAYQMGKDHAATFLTTAPLGAGDETTLTFVLENQSGNVQHNIGRFRISVCNADPAALPKESAPAPILAIAAVPAEQRSPEQKLQLRTYFRTIDPRTAVEQARLQTLEHFVNSESTTQPTSGFAGVRGRAMKLPIAIERRAGFTGDIDVKLIGFSAGRDGGSRLPVVAGKSLNIAALKVAGDQGLVLLSLTPEAGCDLATRKVVLVAEAKVGNETIVQYSPAFDLTVTEK